MAQSKISPIPIPPLHYEARGDILDEVLNSEGSMKEHWQQLLDSFKAMGVEALNERQAKALRILRDDGATYNIYEDPGNASRTWELDLVPAVLSSEEWGKIESGLLERAELLDALLKDIYGARELIRHGVIPPEAIFAHGGFLRATHVLDMPGEHGLIVHAADMVRDASGNFCVFTDRTQAPSGMGYALENRTVMSRVLPSLFRDSQVHRLAPFFHRLRQKLTSLSSTHEQARVVLLTPGSHNETYFEHAYLANYLGFPLVQSGDLVVRNGYVWMKSLDGLSRVDVILRRVDDWYCDPVELRSDSQLGVPGLLEVVRTGRVAIANPLGSGILESPVLLKYLPQISRALLGREPRLASVQTFWCADEEDMAYIEAHLDELVIKPVYRGGGMKSQLLRELSEENRQRLLARMRQSPHQYVAQPCLVASHLPTYVNQHLAPRPAILRSFAVAGEGSYSLMPGGLTRVGTAENAFLISGQLGAQSKDTWVISSEPETVRESSGPSDSSKIAADTKLISLPSRVVENLFWMGRYAERAEASLRILRTVFVMLNGEEPVSELSRKYLLQAVTEVTSTFPGFINCDEQTLANPEAQLLRVVTDANLSGSVRYSFNAMINSADESKELLSSDTLRVINDIRDTLASLDSSLNNGLASAPEEALDPLVTALMALAGLSQESMVRGIGWQFMEMGRRLERSLQTVSMMEQLITPVLDESEQNTLLQALLVSVETLISYRRRYRARMGVRQALELVMLDASNPRSLMFQFEQLKLQIGNLPRNKSGTYELAAEERHIAEVEMIVRMAVLDDLCFEGPEHRPELLSRLQHLRETLNKVSNEISDKYFDHKSGPQQLVSRNWEE